MPKKGGKKKAKVHEDESDLEVLHRMEIIYKDMKAVTRAKPDYLPQKSTKSLRIEFELLDFSNKAATRLTNGVQKTLERCTYFYKRMLTTHNNF